MSCRAWTSLFAAFALAACGVDERVDAPNDVKQPPPGATVMGEFELRVDPAKRTIEVVGFGSSLRGLDPATIVQDGAPGSGPANTIELVTTNVATDVDGSGACGAASSFCGDITINSFYPGALDFVFVELTNTTPAAGHAAIGDDAAQMGLSDAFGLWSYGSIAGGGSGTRQWVFGDDGTAFTIQGRVMADLCINGVQDGAETGIDCGGACLGACTQVTFRLQGAQENPPTPSTAFGDCIVELSGSQNFITVSCQHSVISTAAHVHTGAAGVNGGVLFDLGPGSPIFRTFPISAADAQAFMDGNLYVNVHSAAFPGGEIRGQMGTTVSFPLEGAQEVPANGSAATGRCVVSLSPNQGSLRTACTHNVPNTAAHIHRNVPGVNGPVVFNFGAGNSPILSTNAVAAADVSDFLNGDFYVNVHSAAFPGGEIRGQVAELAVTNGDGIQEVPPNASTATLLCRTYLIPSILELDVRCTHNVVGTTAAHIHQAPIGMNGPVIFNFGAGTSPISTTVALTPGDVVLYRGGNFYFNVHSGTFPGGEIRGQILPPP